MEKDTPTSNTTGIKKQILIIFGLLILLGIIAICILVFPPKAHQGKWVSTLPQVLQRPEYSKYERPRSYLLDQDECVPISELLYEGFLHSGVASSLDQNRSIDKRVRKKCEDNLVASPNNTDTKINFLGAGLRAHDENSFDSYLNKYDVINTLHLAASDGNEEAKFILGWIDSHGYYQGDKRMLDWWLPFLQSNDTHIISVIGVLLAESSKKTPIDMSSKTAQRYLPLEMYKKILNKTGQRKIAIDDWLSQNIHFQLALLFFERAYSLNQDILAGKEIAFMSFWAKGMKKMDEQRSFNIYSELAKHNVPGINANLGAFYMTTLPHLGETIKNFKKDDTIAISYFEKGVVNNNPSAISMLASIYLDKKSGYYNEDHGMQLYCALEPKFRARGIRRKTDGSIIQLECPQN